jgi:hypothetical protein
MGEQPEQFIGVTNTTRQRKATTLYHLFYFFPVYLGMEDVMLFMCPFLCVCFRPCYLVWSEHGAAV